VHGIVPRLLFLGSAFSFELLAITLWPGGSLLTGRPGLGGFIGAWGAMAPRAIVGFAVFFPTFGWLNFGWLNYRTAFANVGREAVESVFQWRFIPHLIVKLPLLQIGTPRFQVEVAPECSGLEGIGLMLAFGVYLDRPVSRTMPLPAGFSAAAGRRGSDFSAQQRPHNGADSDR
jgi:hypothetical protein